MENEITNRIENSGLVQVNLDDYYPMGERDLFDLKPWLKEDLILIEKDFRAFVSMHDWSVYKDKYIGIICSSDAVIPLWAYMLVASQIELYAKKVVKGNKMELEKAIFNEVLAELDYSQFQDAIIIVKGCGKYPIPESIFVEFSVRLQAYAKKIMFGEACSTVPLFKR